MRTDPASQARQSSHFSMIRALVAALVLAGLALLPAVCRGAEAGACGTISPPDGSAPMLSPAMLFASSLTTGLSF